MSESFHWNHPGLDWSHFHSLANLLSLRNGGQAEPCSLPDQLLDEDWDSDDSEDEDAPSVVTNLNHQLSGSGHARLKRRFLDCLAEFAANKKGGTAVACCAMEEAENSVAVWIARNDGFADADQAVFERLGELLGLLSNDDGLRSETLLWEKMVAYHRTRIEEHIAVLRGCFKAYDTLHQAQTTESNLSALRTVLFDCGHDETNTIEKNEKLVLASYNVRQTKETEEMLHSSLSATSKSKNLWLSICMLARLRVAFQKFKDITLALPSFQRVSITLVSCPPSPANMSQHLLTLEETFNVLDLQLNPDTTKAVLGQKWAVARSKREFRKRQKQTLNIHTEVQMLMFLDSSKCQTSNCFPYLGCSKLSCFMCDRFIRSLGRFKTRGCHGRLFRAWTVPCMDKLSPGHADQTAKALISVQKDVQKSLKAPIKDPIRLERTSVAGTSSVLGGGQEQRSQRQLQIDRLAINAERLRVAQFLRQTDEHLGSPLQKYSTAEGSSLYTECDVCFKATTRRCSLCNKYFFCNDSCQEKSSGRHLFTCSKRPLTSADYLWQSLSDDLMPLEEDVLEDFGFNNVPSQDKTKLLGVYIGLCRFGKSSPEVLNEWRVKGLLAEKINEFYLDIPRECRGGYFPWFLENLHVLEHPLTKDKADQKMIATFLDKAKPYLNIGDRKKAAKDLMPEAKRASYILLAQILQNFSPSPTESNWRTFGFATCRNPAEETILVQLYQLLLTNSDGSAFYEIHNRHRTVVTPATFTQFWSAHQAGTLIQLMDAKALKTFRSRLPLLERFLSVPPTAPRPSVWDLKQFLEIGDPIEHPPIPSVSFDYGFVNCRKFEDTCALMEIYIVVLRVAEPLDLHRACVAGELFLFASRCVKMEERWRLLMGNMYPLGSVVQPVAEQGLGVKLKPGASGDIAELPSLLSMIWRFVGKPFG